MCVPDTSQKWPLSLLGKSMFTMSEGETSGTAIYQLVYTGTSAELDHRRLRMDNLKSFVCSSWT